MRLRDVLSRHPSHADAVRSPTGSATFGALIGPAPLGVLEASEFRNVAVRIHDPLRLARALAALDGAVARLMLLSYDTPPDVAAALLKTAEIEAVLTDAPDAAPETEARLITWDDACGDEALPLARDTEWVLATSGTTGTPKLVAHQLASLTRTTVQSASGRAQIWGEVYNICRFAGLQVLLQSYVGGGTLILAPLDRSLGDQIGFLGSEGVTALSATPTLWRKILMTPETDRIALQQVTLGGEIADDAILRALAARFPSARIVHIYASTEAGVGFSVKDKRAGFPASYLEEGYGNISLKIHDGRLFVRNDQVRPGYFGAEDRFADAQAYIDTGDNVEVRDGRVYFLGRATGMINVGGNKLYPEEVERVLLEHPGVRLARVTGKKSPITGQLVAADIAPSDSQADPAALKASVLAHCRARLEAWKTPALIRVVPDIDANSGGKVSRSTS